MTINEALQRLVPGLREIYGDALEAITLYGSEARGTATAESDVDIALIIRGSTTKEMHMQMIGLVAGLELECDRVLSVIPIDADKFHEWEDVLPFYINIKEEGIQLWPAA